MTAREVTDPEAQQKAIYADPRWVELLKYVSAPVTGADEGRAQSFATVWHQPDQGTDYALILESVTISPQGERAEEIKVYYGDEHSITVLYEESRR